jgi:hypothetical protein
LSITRAYGPVMAASWVVLLIACWC